MDYIAIAIAPGIAICLFIFYKDIYNREPKLNLIVSFILGCFAIVPAIFFEDAFSYTNDRTVTGVAIFSYAIVAFSEEFSKFIGLRLYAYNQKSFDEPLDGIVYGVMVSMGFATLENIMYVLKYAEIGMGYEVGIKRMFLSVPAHATFGVVMGYFIGKAKSDPKNSFMLMVAGLLSAIFLHGTYDFFLFVYETTIWGRQTGETLLVGGAIVSFILSLILSRKLIKSHRKLSKEMFIIKKDDTSV
ncbi:MAG: PrsW family intramembrane metalloprotease [Chitinophagaceae bacterium]|nr:PrsW family intramembrane metalloprotease [Chitinophagaceae bacterium]